MTKGRVKVRLDPDIFRLMLTEGHECHSTCTQGLPVDAEFVSFYKDPETQDFMLVFQAEAFEPIPSSAIVPELPLRWRSNGG